MFKMGVLGYVISPQKYVICQPVCSQSCRENPYLLTGEVVGKVLLKVGSYLSAL